MGKKYNGEQNLQRNKTARVSDDYDKKNQIRANDVEIAIPIVYGTISFWLGKRADEHRTHRWTVYIRGATNEDLSIAIKRVVFELHPSFNSPIRVVDSAPFELSETGWGEFQIKMTIFFHSDVAEKPLELYHELKLHPEDRSGPPTTKKPVVVESYDEIVFTDPSEAFYLRAREHPAVIVSGSPSGLSLTPPSVSTFVIPIAKEMHFVSGIANDNFSEKKRGDTKEHSLSQWFLRHSEADELAQLVAARQQIQSHIVRLRRQLSMIEAETQRMQSNSSQ